LARLFTVTLTQLSVSVKLSS